MYPYIIYNITRKWNRVQRNVPKNKIEKNKNGSVAWVVYCYMYMYALHIDYLSTYTYKHTYPNKYDMILKLLIFYASLYPW